MGTTYRLQQGAIDYLDWLGRSISECVMPGSLRVRVAASCLAIAQDHHHAIVALLDRGLFASAFALLRCEFEAYVRGEWLAVCATDEEVENFSKNARPPELAKLIAQLERTDAFSEKVLASIKARSWDAMCAYTHTGGLHVQRWGVGNVIEPNYDPAEIEEALSFAEIFGALAVVGVASLANDESTAAAVLAKVRERTGYES
jgi:hypothetical protein